MLIIIALLIGILPSVFSCFSNSKSKDGKSLYLTESTETYYGANFQALDQCSRTYSTQTKFNSFALKFQLDAKCDNGLLICYPGTLDSGNPMSSYGLGPEVHFKVPNIVGNEIADACEQKKRQEKCRKRPKCCEGFNGKAVWHGIRVSTKPEPAGHYSPQIELSISKQKYNLSMDLTDFSLLFGDPTNLVTKMIDVEDSPIKLPIDDAIREAFLNRSNAGVHLAKYAGLWMLALDLLPLHNQRILQLYVYRECGCEMHAWFVRPNDQPVPYSTKLVPELENCVDVAYRDSPALTLPSPVTFDNTLELRFRLNNHPRMVHIQFGNEREKNLLTIELNGHTKAGMGPNRTKGKMKCASTFLEQSMDLVTPKRQSKLVANGVCFDTTRYMHVVILIRKYYYEVKAARLIAKYFPRIDDWWKRGPVEHISQIRVYGDLYTETIVRPVMVPSPMKLSNLGQTDSYTLLNEPLDEGDTLIIRGQIAADAENIQIELLHNVPEYNRYLGWALCIIRIKKFKENGDLLDLAAQSAWNDNNAEEVHPKDWFFIHRNRTFNFLQRGIPFECHFNLSRTHDGSNMSVFLHTNQSSTEMPEFPLKSPPINSIHISGDLVLFTEPQIKRGKRPKGVFVLKLNPLLSVGDSIILAGQMEKNGSYLSIKFLHDTTNPISIGLTPFYIEFNFASMITRMGTINHFKINSPEHVWMKNISECRLSAGEIFRIEIKVRATKYFVYVHGGLAGNYTHVLPPWAVDHIRVEGDLFWHKLWRDSSRGMFPPRSNKLKLPYLVHINKEVDAGNLLIRSGDLIRISGVVNRTAGISVSLLNVALETYRTVTPTVMQHHKRAKLPKIGKIVLLANFGQTHLELSERYFGEKHRQIAKIPLEQPLMVGDNFDLTIRFTGKNQFELHLADHITIVNQTVLPIWAIQYVRVEGPLTLIEAPKVVFARNSKKAIVKEH